MIQARTAEHRRASCLRITFTRHVGAVAKGGRGPACSCTLAGFQQCRRRSCGTGRSFLSNSQLLLRCFQVHCHSQHLSQSVLPRTNLGADHGSALQLLAQLLPSTSTHQLVHCTDDCRDYRLSKLLLLQVAKLLLLQASKLLLLQVAKLLLLRPLRAVFRQTELISSSVIMCIQTPHLLAIAAPNLLQVLSECRFRSRCVVHSTPGVVIRGWMVGSSNRHASNTTTI
jgi:hypothetical protein